MVKWLFTVYENDDGSIFVESPTGRKDSIASATHAQMIKDIKEFQDSESRFERAQSEEEKAN